MNRSAARTLVEESTGRTDKTSLINSALDLAVKEVSKAKLWSTMLVEDTVSLLIATSSIALATDANRIVELRVVDGSSSYKLQIRSRTFVIQRWPDVTALNDSKPAWGYFVGKTLHVVPAADQAYTIGYAYYRLHPALAADSDELLIDVADAAVIAYASYWVFLSLQQAEDAALWMATYKDRLGEAKEADHSSATEVFLRPYNEAVPVQPDYYLDPFVGHNPRWW